MSPAAAAAPMAASLTIGGVTIPRGSLGRAPADRIAGRHRGAGGGDAEQAQPLERAMPEPDELKHRVAEVEKRLLAAHRPPARQER